MVKDRIFIGSMAGTIGTLFKDIPNFIFYKLGIVQCTYANLAASAHLDPGQIHTPIGYIIGITGDMVTGGVLGILLILFLDWSGPDFWWFKGLIIGNGLWLFALGVILNLGTVHFVPADPVFRLMSILDHWLYGLATVYIIHQWTKVKGGSTLK